MNVKDRSAEGAGGRRQRTGGADEPPAAACQGPGGSARLEAATVIAGRDLLVAGELHLTEWKREVDPRLSRWLLRLARLVNRGWVSEEEYHDLKRWAAGRELCEEATVEDQSRLLSEQVDVARQLLFEGAVDGPALAGELVSSPQEARRRQLLVALRMHVEPCIECLGMRFFLVPPGRSAVGGWCNRSPVFLAETAVSEAVWARVMAEEDAGARPDRARVQVPRRRIESFLLAAQQQLEGRALVTLPSAEQLAFAEEAGGRTSPPAGAAAAVPRLGLGAPSSLGLHDLSGVVYQLCRDDDGWSWWGGSPLASPWSFSGGPPRRPSRSSFEQGPDHGFRPLLHLHGLRPTAVP